mmetsp:Transcript_24573/g.58319  ORF Transcript_24573/g.58319 Transcript_24573/m.58319 type:complete len:236 (+) Transcript_24573:17-724(+)
MRDVRALWCAKIERARSSRGLPATAAGTAAGATRHARRADVDDRQGRDAGQHCRLDPPGAEHTNERHLGLRALRVDAVLELDAPVAVGHAAHHLALIARVRTGSQLHLGAFRQVPAHGLGALCSQLARAGIVRHLEDVLGDLSRAEGALAGDGLQCAVETVRPAPPRALHGIGKAELLSEKRSDVVDLGVDAQRSDVVVLGALQRHDHPTESALVASLCALGAGGEHAVGVHAAQ